MTASLDQLLTPVTEDQALETILDALREADYDVDSWQKGSVQLTAFRGVAKVAAGINGYANSVFRGMILGLSREGWLDIIGRFFQLPRLEARAAILEVRWTSSASAPAQSIAVGDLLRIGDQTYSSLDSTTVAPSSTDTIEVQCLATGDVGNKPLGTSASWVTPHTGVTLALEPQGAPDEGTAIVTAGVAREGDDRYTYRLGLRWAELTYAVGFRAYELWALTASPTITRVRVLENYPTANAIRVALANATGPATGAEVAEVQAYFTDQRRAINDDPTAVAAADHPLAIALAPRIRSGGATSADVEAAILAYLNTLQIGGTRIAGATAGRVLRDGIILAVGQLPGVVSVGLSAPATDELLGGTDIVSVSSMTVSVETFFGAL